MTKKKFASTTQPTRIDSTATRLQRQPLRRTRRHTATAAMRGARLLLPVLLPAALAETWQREYGVCYTRNNAKSPTARATEENLRKVIVSARSLRKADAALPARRPRGRRREATTRRAVFWADRGDAAGARRGRLGGHPSGPVRGADPRRRRRGGGAARTSRRARWPQVCLFTDLSHRAIQRIAGPTLFDPILADGYSKFIARTDTEAILLKTPDDNDDADAHLKHAKLRAVTPSRCGVLARGVGAGAFRNTSSTFSRGRPDPRSVPALRRSSRRVSGASSTSRRRPFERRSS